MLKRMTTLEQSPVNTTNTCLYCTVSYTVLVPYTDVGGEGGFVM